MVCLDAPRTSHSLGWTHPCCYVEPNSTVSASTFDSNRALEGGALHLSSSCTLNIHNSTFSNNLADATGSGGALYVAAGSSMQASGVVFISNTAHTGGGLAVLGRTAVATLTNCTLSACRATSSGGGLYAGSAATM